MASVAASAEDYAPRMLFGDYVCELVAQAGDRLEIIAGDAVDSRSPTTAASGSVSPTAAASRPTRSCWRWAIFRPAPPRGIDPAALGAVYVDDPWYGGFGDGLAPTTPSCCSAPL